MWVAFCDLNTLFAFLMLCSPVIAPSAWNSLRTECRTKIFLSCLLDNTYKNVNKHFHIISSWKLKEQSSSANKGLPVRETLVTRKMTLKVNSSTKRESNKAQPQPRREHIVERIFTYSYSLF